MLKKIVIGIIVLGVAAYWIAAVTVLNKPEKGMVCDGVEIMTVSYTHLTLPTIA